MGCNYLSIPKLQQCNCWSLGMDKKFHPTLYWACDYLSMLRWMLNHVSKRGPRVQFLSVTQSKLRLCSANHRAGYFSNLACDWLSIVWAYSEQETENGPRIGAGHDILIEEHFCITGPLWTESTGHWRSPLTKNQHWGALVFLCC